MVSLEDLACFVAELETEIKTKGSLDEENIIARLSECTGVPTWTLKSKKRTQDVADARYAGCYLLSVNGKSTVDIGKYFGGRDHSTAIHSREKMKQILKEYKHLGMPANTSTEIQTSYTSTESES